jgi:site-specific recombinase XerD
MVAGQPVNTHTIHHRFATHLLDGGLAASASHGYWDV